MYNAKVSNILEGPKNQNKNSDFLTKKPDGIVLHGLKNTTLHPFI